jgi:Putative Ig domain
MLGPRRLVAVLAVLAAASLVATPQVAAKPAEPKSASDALVYDIFGRNLDAYGVRLVDWEGYLANPYVELTIRPYANAVFPLTIDLAARGTSRLMMDLPSELTATGATKTVRLTGPADREIVRLAIHSKRGPGPDERYRLTMTTTDGNGAASEHTMPIRVQQDQKRKPEPTIPIDFDYRYDTITGYFADPKFRKAAEAAVNDWYSFFDIEPFDTVPAETETLQLPGDNWEDPVAATNNQDYNGMWVFFRGIQVPYSTGFPANNGSFHTRNGEQVPGPIHRSTAMIFEYDEENMELFTSLADEDWYLTDLGRYIDVHGLVMHEYGHAMAYHSWWNGMRRYVESDGQNDSDVIDYQGYPVPLDTSYHIPGELAYWDRLSGQNGGWIHLFPTRRWMLTKLTLLVAENAGWPLNRELTPFLEPAIRTRSVPGAVSGERYRSDLSAEGGVPFYDWQIVDGALPDGLSLNRFTGTIAGTVAAAPGRYAFTVQLRDYDRRSDPVLRTYRLRVSPG